MDLKRETFEFRCDDGRELFVYAWLPAEPSAVVQIAHGAAEHAARYAHVAERLADAGYAVYANDHRGHGRTARGPAELGALGETGGWNRVVADLAGLNRHFGQRHPGLPIVLMGHSLGSFMTQQYLFEHGETLAAAVLSGSTKVELPAPPEEPPPDLSELPNPMAALNAAFEPARTEFDWLSRDPAEVDKYIADPLCGFPLSAGTLMDMAALPQRLYTDENLARIPRALPLYLFAGDRDPVNAGLTGLHALIDCYTRAGLTGLRHRFYAEGRHEMLNETNRDEVIDDLIAWLDEVLP